MAKRSGARRQAAHNPHGYLGEVAGFTEPAAEWLEGVQARMEAVYDDDPLLILHSVRQMMLGGFSSLDEEARLQSFAQDYAAYWLAEQLQGRGQPGAAVQQDYWRESLAIPGCRQFDLIHAHLGWDLLTPRLGEHQSTLLMLFSADASPEETQAFVECVPTLLRPAYLNATNRLGMTVVHGQAYGAQQGVLSVLVGAGAQLDAVTRIQMSDGYAPEVTVAHLAVVNAQPYLAIELMALDRNLFAGQAGGGARLLDHTPLELGLMQFEDAQDGEGRAQLWHMVTNSFGHLARSGKTAAEVPPPKPPLARAHFAQLQRAINLAAYALDRPLPFGEYLDILRDLSPETAPRPKLQVMTLN